MRTTPVTPSASVLAASAQAYAQKGWLVSETSNGISLVTDNNVCGIEVDETVADQVSVYLRANKLTGPVIELPGAERRIVFLATGVSKATRALDALREFGATIHAEGASLPLPPTKMIAGCARWVVAPEECSWVPPVVAISAALRAVRVQPGKLARVAS
ncbi:MAG: hypothetical protein LLG14_15655 [Nocardiaceae bacterium]|nr:hypothetical protein [Nocardiaceae bacterium]